MMETFSHVLVPYPRAYGLIFDKSRSIRAISRRVVAVRNVLTRCYNHQPFLLVAHTHTHTYTRHKPLGVSSPVHHPLFDRMGRTEEGWLRKLCVEPGNYFGTRTATLYGAAYAHTHKHSHAQLVSYDISHLLVRKGVLPG